MGRGKLIGVRRAAGILYCSSSTVIRWADNGIIPCYRVGPRRDRKFLKSELLKVVEDWRQPQKGKSDSSGA